MTKKTRNPLFLVSLVAVSLLALTLPGLASAQEVGTSRNFGLGLALGSPSGLSAEYYLNQKNALQATLGLGFVGGNHLNVTVDYLFHHNLMGQGAFKLDAYIGLGGFFYSWFDDDEGEGNDDKEAFGIGARVPLGLDMIFTKLPIDIYLEVAPGFALVGRTGFGVSGALGFRYFF